MKSSKNLKPDVTEFIKQREKLLKEHPELKPVQKKIENTLIKVGQNPDSRAKAVFEQMFQQYEKELSPVLSEMESIKSIMNEIKSKKKGGKIDPKGKK